MIMSSRIIWSDNSVIKDISVNQNSYADGSDVIDYVAGQDYIFIGADFPFNHRHINVLVSNAVSSIASVDLWDGKTWNPAVDIIDQTKVLGASMSESGVISWRPDENTQWQKDDTNLNNHSITGLSSLKIFGLYWARLSWSVSWTGTTALSYIGHKFSEDYDMFILYPEFSLSTVKGQFLTGKTTWDEQHLQAGIAIIRDLKKMRVAVSGNQILDWEIFKEASVHKTAAIIYQAFGKDFFPNADRAEAKYKESIENSIKLIDQNNDAKVQSNERLSIDGWISR